MHEFSYGLIIIKVDQPKVSVLLLVPDKGSSKGTVSQGMQAYLETARSGKSKIKYDEIIPSSRWLHSIL